MCRETVVKTIIVACRPDDDRKKRGRFVHIDYLQSVCTPFGLNARNDEFDLELAETMHDEASEKI